MPAPKGFNIGDPPVFAVGQTVLCRHYADSRAVRCVVVAIVEEPLARGDGGLDSRWYRCRPLESVEGSAVNTESALPDGTYDFGSREITAA